MKANIVFKYKDEDGFEREVALSSIIANIGFEYSIPDDVLKLVSTKEITEVKINDDVVWSIARKSYVGIICKNASDFNDYLKEKNIKGERQTTKIIHTESRTYICFASVCDTKLWGVDNFYETELAKENKEYDTIRKIVLSSLPSVAQP